MSACCPLLSSPQSRWTPTVSEYQQAGEGSSIGAMKPVAAQLMTALPPKDNVDLMASANEMIMRGG